jgi:DNA polymerase-3 subunit epsilon
MFARVTRPRHPGLAARRMPWRRAAFASLDFETTGLDRSRDAVVSFGVVPIDDGRVRVGGAVHQYVAAAVPSSVPSMRIHEILPRDLVDAPSMDDARDRLRASLDRRFVLAWYAGVEIAFLGRVFGGSERWWRRRTIDVRDLAIAVEGADRDARFGLTATAERFGVPVATPHEALDDALVTAQLFLVLATRLAARGASTVAALARSGR